MNDKCYAVLQEIETLSDSENIEQNKKSQFITVGETLGGALLLIGRFLLDLEHDEPSYRNVDIQSGNGLLGKDGKSWILRIISEITEKKIKITHTIWLCLTSL